MTTRKTKTTSIADKLQSVEQLIDRLQRRLNRTHNALVKAQRQRSRLQKFAAADMADRTAKIAAENEKRREASQVETDHMNEAQFMSFVEKGAAAEAAAATAAIAAKPKDDDSIPAFLLRSGKASLTDADEKAIKEIVEGQQAKAKVKAKASSEKSRAKKRGELRKMPLQGKAALAAIRAAK